MAARGARLCSLLLLAALAGLGAEAKVSGAGDTGHGGAPGTGPSLRPPPPPAARFPRVVPLSWPRCCPGWLQEKAGAGGFVRALPCPARWRSRARRRGRGASPGSCLPFSS